MDGGQTWDPCKLSNTPKKHAWVRWTYTWNALKKGEYTIKTRATDTEGNRQPGKPLWNRKGYGYNAIDKITVKVE